MSQKATLYYIADVTADARLVAAIRRSVDQWASARPHHPYPDLGTKMEITKVCFNPTYRAVVRSQTETHRLVNLQVPYTTQHIPPLVYPTAASVDTWKVPMPAVGDFTDSEVTYVVPGSQRVELCPSCRGRGEHTCSTCNGHKKVTCSDCGGTCKVVCSHCHGTKGTVTTYSDGSKTTQNCYYCSGQGKQRCMRCNNGKVTCSTCSGTGTTMCYKCQGKGRLMLYFGVERELAVYSSAVNVISDDLIDAVAEFYDRASEFDYRRFFLRRAPSVKASDYGDNPMAGNVSDLVDSARKQVAGRTTLFQELTAGEIETWEVWYRFGGKDYYLALTGPDMEVSASTSPISDVALDIWKQGYGLYGKGSYYQAAHQFDKLVKMEIYDYQVNARKSLDGAVEAMQRQSKVGVWMGTVFSTIFILYIASFYYTEVNYVFKYAGFLNRGGLLSSDHEWSMVAFTVILCLLSAFIGKEFIAGPSRVPSAFGRLMVGFGIGVAVSVATAVVIALVNCTGITILVALLGWVLGVLLMLVAGLIALVVQLFKWIF